MESAERDVGGVAYLDQPTPSAMRVPASGFSYGSSIKPTMMGCRTMQREISPMSVTGYTGTDSTSTQTLTFDLLSGQGSSTVGIEGKDLRLKGSLYLQSNTSVDFFLENGYSSLIRDMSLIINGERETITQYPKIRTFLDDMTCSQSYRRGLGSITEGLAYTDEAQLTLERPAGNITSIVIPSVGLTGDPPNATVAQTISNSPMSITGGISGGYSTTGEPVINSATAPAFSGAYAFDFSLTHPALTTQEYFPIIGLKQAQLELTFSPPSSHYVEKLAAPATGHVIEIKEKILNLKMVVPYIIQKENYQQLRDDILLKGIPRYIVPRFKTMEIPLSENITEFTQQLPFHVSSARYLVMMVQQTANLYTHYIRSYTQFNLMNINEVWLESDGEDIPSNHIFPLLSGSFPQIQEAIKLVTHTSDTTYDPRILPHLIGGATGKERYLENRDYIVIDLSMINEDATRMISGRRLRGNAILRFKFSAGLPEASILTLFLCNDALLTRHPISGKDTITFDDIFGVEKEFM